MKNQGSMRGGGSGRVEGNHWGWKEWAARVVKNRLKICARDVNIFLTACQGWRMQNVWRGDIFWERN